MNTIINLFLREKKAVLTGIGLGISSGLLSFAFLTFLNYMIGQVLGEVYTQVNWLLVIAFAAIILLFIWARRELAYHIIRYSQNLFWKLRVEVLSVILRADYSQMQEQRGRIHSALVSDINVLTQAALSIIDFITSAVIVIACFSYMWWLSWELFLITLLTTLLGMGVYQLGAGRNARNFEQSRNLEDGFMHYFTAIVNGFKEIHLNPLKGEAILQRKITPISKHAFRTNADAFVGYLNNQITGQILFYSLISAILLIGSIMIEIETITTINFLFILLYLLGAIETLMILLPGLVRGQISINRLNTLKEDLAKEEYKNSIDKEKPAIADFENISIKGLQFKYTGKEQFGIGPIDFDLRKQEIAFVYGGNGSGKTTFIHALLGLLQPEEGSISFNGQELNGETYSRYKALFAVVFNDFYLFDEFFGNEDFDKEKALKYLKLFEMEDKVEMTDAGFSTTDLSTGQRKRLALIAALLEERPVLVLDEWAGDQDPYFRKKFYTEILPTIKADGFTILAITHDDKYYDHSDSIYKMEYGALLKEEPNAAVAE